MTIEKYTQEEIDNTKGRTNPERLKNKTDKEIEEAAKSDPDSALPTDEELKQFKRPSEAQRKRFQKDDNS